MLLSIIISVYNGEEFVESCIRSVRERLTDEMELVVVDDGSTDNTWELIENAMLTDSRVRGIHIENIGLPGSRIEGAVVASGEYLYFMDVDDSLNDDFFYDIPHELEENRPDVILFDARRVFPDNRRPVGIENRVESGLYGRKEVEDRIITKLFCTHDLYGNRDIIPNVWTKVFRRDLFISSTASLKGKRIIIGEDLALSASVIMNASSVSVLPHKPYYNYLTNSSSIMNNYKENVFRETSFLCEYLEGLSADERYRRQICYERAFFAISAYYNEFFYISAKTGAEKKETVSMICSDPVLACALRQISLREVKFPGSLIVSCLMKGRLGLLMGIGSFIRLARPLIAKFVLS